MSIWGLNNFYIPTAFMAYSPLNFGANFFTPSFPMFGSGYNFAFYKVPDNIFVYKKQSYSAPKTNVFSFLDVYNSLQKSTIGIKNDIYSGILSAKKTEEKAKNVLLKSEKDIDKNDKKEIHYPNTEVNNKKRETDKNVKKVHYNKRKGEKLAKEIASVSSEGGFDGYCARHVKSAISDAGLGKYESGHGYQVADILADNKNFKEITSANPDLESLPAGCVLVYDRGVSGYSSRYGHTEITLGNGTAASGGITHNIRDGARVFIPV